MKTSSLRRVSYSIIIVVQKLDLNKIRKLLWYVINTSVSMLSLVTWVEHFVQRHCRW